ncbi:MAG: molybdenum cofactor biosynthesis protein MoaE, partial [Lysobacterales bacterium]
MSRFTVTHETIALDAFRRSMDDPSCGAYVQFEGRVRNHNEGKAVLRLEYEIYEPLAVREGERILDEAIARHGVEKAAAQHRGGSMDLGEVAVVVGVSAAHRDEAFAACRYIIDELK